MLHHSRTKPDFALAVEPDPPPPPAVPLPTTPSELGDTEGDDDSPEWCACGAVAVTLQSLAIDAVYRRNRICEGAA